MRRDSARLRVGLPKVARRSLDGALMQPSALQRPCLSEPELGRNLQAVLLETSRIRSSVNTADQCSPSPISPYLDQQTVHLDFSWEFLAARAGSRQHCQPDGVAHNHPLAD